MVVRSGSLQISGYWPTIHPAARSGSATAPYRHHALTWSQDQVMFDRTKTSRVCRLDVFITLSGALILAQARMSTRFVGLLVPAISRVRDSL